MANIGKLISGGFESTTVPLTGATDSVVKLGDGDKIGFYYDTLASDPTLSFDDTEEEFRLAWTDSASRLITLVAHNDTTDYSGGDLFQLIGRSGNDTPEAHDYCNIKYVINNTDTGFEDANIEIQCADPTDSGQMNTYINVNGSGNGETEFTKDVYFNQTSIVFDDAGTSKIGTAANQKFAFWGATAVVQPLHVADATDAASVITQLNELLLKLETIGLLASA